MTRRHDVQNLLRRGNIWYWRPRLPATLSQSDLNRKLSFSLRQTDHNRAKFMARRLNTMLAEMRFRPDLKTTRQDALNALFKAEIERMNELMDDLVIAAKATGNHHKPTHLEADLITGWAFRLLEEFGTAIDLSFDEACQGRQFLLQNNVPNDFVPMIAETFRQERQFARSRRFEVPLKQEMAEVGLEVNRLNLERSRSEVFRAKADVLLNTGSRYRVLQVASTEQGTGDQAADLHVVPQGSGGLNTLQDVSSAETSDNPATDENSVPSPNAPFIKPTEPEDEVLPDGRQARLPVSEFLDLFEVYRRNKAEEWKSETANDVRVAIRMFHDVLVFNGVEHTGEIRQAHLAAFRDLLSLLPKNYGQSSRLRALSFIELKAVGERMLDEVDDDDAAKVGFKAQTVRKHLGSVDGFRDFLAGRGHQIISFEMNGIRPNKVRASEIALLTPKPGPDKTEAMFGMPIFSGARSEIQQKETGSLTLHNSLYFLPMLLVYLGMRRAEAAGLLVDEIVSTPNGWAIEIKANKIRGLKNRQSTRMLPVPQEMLRLSFLDYVEKIRSLGYRPLFPELVNPYVKKSDPGDRFYKNFNPLFVSNAANGGPSWIRVLHALRHGHADTLKQNGISPELIEDIQGRDGASETGIRYTNPAGLPLLKDLLTKYPVVTGHLEPSPIRLLSFVDAREPAPWFEDPDEKRGRRGNRTK